MLESSRDSRLIDIALDLRWSTGKAYLVSDGTKEVWLPISQVENSDEVKVGESGVFVMPEWLAKDKGLI